MYHNRFDVVHIRFLVAAIPKNEIARVTANLFTLISMVIISILPSLRFEEPHLTNTEPGGYLQWSDFTYTHGRESIYPAGPVGLSCRAEGEFLFRFAKEQGWCSHLVGDVKQALSNFPMVLESIRDYTTVPHQHPEMADLIAEWHARTTPALLEEVMLRKGALYEEVDFMWAFYPQRIRVMRQRGVVFQMPLTTLVARKESLM